MIEHGTPTDESARPLFNALGRGWRRRCPRCGNGGLFDGYLKVREQCTRCQLELHHHRADDAPPYFTIMIVGHVIIAGMLWLETGWHPPAWVHLSLWLPLTIALTLALLPLVKGALIGWQWALRMHGFDSAAADV